MYGEEGEKRYCRHRAAREQEKDLLHAWMLHRSSMGMAPGMGRWEEVTATPLRWSILRGLGRNSVLASRTHSSISMRSDGPGHWESTGRSELVGVELVQGVDKQLEHGCEYFMCHGI